MKAIITLTLFCLIWLNMVAQTPQAFKYQAMARNTAGEVLVNKPVSFRIGILSGSANGSAVYTETHTGKLTNAFGLVDLEIGKGTTVTGTFAGISWGTNDYFLKVELDPNGGSSYQAMGTTQLLSVPYALYARDVENNADGDADASNELQKISISGTVLTLDKSGGSVTLPTGGTSGDNWGTQTVLTDATLTGNGTTATPLKIADNGITSAKILDGSIVTADLADQTVSTAKLGNFAVSADKIQSGAVITDKLANGSVTGTKIAQASATNGQVLKWDGITWLPANDNSSFWQQAGSKIYYNNGYVGIGIVDPKKQLHVHSSTLNSGIQFTNDVSGSNIDDGFMIAQQYQSETSNRYALILNNESTSLWIGTNKIYQQLILNPDGNVGVGSASADAKFQVAGQVRITGGTPGTGKVLTSDAAGLASWQTPSGGFTLPYGGSVFADGLAFSIINTSTSSGVAGEAIKGSTNNSEGTGVHGFASSSEGTTIGVHGEVNSPLGYSGFFQGGRFWVEGNVGIGVLHPSTKLEVNGQVKIAGGSPGLGKVLTSDSYGLATWQIPPFMNSSTDAYFTNSGNVGIGNTAPGYKLDVTGNRIRLAEATGDWIAMRTDGGTDDLLDLSYGGGSLVIQGTTSNENILMNPTMNKVGIRTWSPQYDLDVNGNIRATGSVFYGGTAGAANGTAYNKPDYVFGDDYVGMSTEQVEDFLNHENHLPWMTSAIQEKKENGEVTDMTRMAFETLESVENLQLQLIMQNKLIQSLKNENDRQKAENVEVVSRIERLEKLAQESPLIGTWSLVSYKYILENGNEENLEVKKCIRVYNNTHFSVFWEYKDSTTETCIAKYSLQGEKLKLKVLLHTNLPVIGREFTGISRVSDNKLFHFVDIDGYIIMEIYEPLNIDNTATIPLKPDARNLYAMAVELKRYGKQKDNPKLVDLGEIWLKKAVELDPSLNSVEY